MYRPWQNISSPKTSLSCPTATCCGSLRALVHKLAKSLVIVNWMVGDRIRKNYIARLKERLPVSIYNGIRLPRLLT